MADPFTNPYAAPESMTALGKRAPVSPLVFLGVSFGLFVITVLLMFLSGSIMPALPGFALATLIAMAGAGRGIHALVTAGPSRVGNALATVMNILMSLLGAFATYVSIFGVSRGRQLRRFGRVLLPRVEPGDAWTTVRTEVVIDPSQRQALAAQWRENGRTEHASVAAFARLTLDLMALGAPPELVAASNRDALDEIRHAELCFSLARAIDGASQSPAPFPEASRARTLVSSRPFALAQLAVHSLIDGALHEGLSARVIAKLAKRCEVPAIRDLLKELAADEGRHAAHGWDVVLWCIAEGGEPVVHALRAAARALPSSVDSGLPQAAIGGEWERFGIHGRALEREQYAVAHADVVARIERLVLRDCA